MVNLTVYGHPKATCTQRLLIVLEELELKYDFKNVDIMQGESRTEEFLEKNPFGKVPVVMYGDKTLIESRAIMRYIAKNNKEPIDLFPDVYADVWLEVEAQNFNPHISKVVYEKLFKKWKNEECDEEAVNKALEGLGPVLDIYNARLEKSEYISGDAFTIADISHIPYAYYFLKCGYKETLKSRPALYDWLKRIMRRPSVRRILDGKFGEDAQ